MGVAQFIIEAIFTAANVALDHAFVWGGLVLIFAYPIYFFVHNLKKYTDQRKSTELIIQTMILFAISIAMGIVWMLPEFILFIIKWHQNDLTFTTFINTWQKNLWIYSTARWIELALAFLAFAYVFGREHGGKRWTYSAAGHIAVIFVGWFLFLNRWMGIFFISVPMIVAYYCAMYDLAMIVMPTSNPEDRTEKKKRFHAFLSYTWGIQSPMTVVDGHAWKKYEPRIPGDMTWSFSDFPIPIIKSLDWRPGLVWTRSHQVVAVSGGTKFKRVDGPGVVFTSRLERLDQIFDLRIQLRTKEIDVVSKDGIRFIARYFTAFRLDNEEWSRDFYNTLRPMNAILRGANKLSYEKGSFHFSNLRVQAALGMTSTKAAVGDPLVYWDQWVMNIVEDQTRKVISQKNLDEMWRPANDKKFANALDVIANEIKQNSELAMRAAGILLLTARVVNFHFSAADGKVDEITRQQIATWCSEWDGKRATILAKADAESERAQQEARAYAEALLLGSIAQGLQKTQEINPNLPRYVIAMRFLSSLQDYVQKNPPDNDGNKEREEQKKITQLSNSFKEWQELFYPNQGAEK